MFLTIILSTIAYLLGVAIQRRYRDDPVACAFADALIGCVAIPIAAIKARLMHAAANAAVKNILTEPADSKPNGRRSKTETA